MILYAEILLLSTRNTTVRLLIILIHHINSCILWLECMHACKINMHFVVVQNFRRVSAYFIYLLVQFVWPANLEMQFWAAKNTLKKDIKTIQVSPHLVIAFGCSKMVAK